MAHFVPTTVTLTIQVMARAHESRPGRLQYISIYQTYLLSDRYKTLQQTLETLQHRIQELDDHFQAQPYSQLCLVYNIDPAKPDQRVEDLTRTLSPQQTIKPFVSYAKSNLAVFQVYGYCGLE